MKYRREICAIISSIRDRFRLIQKYVYNRGPEQVFPSDLTLRVLDSWHEVNPIVGSMFIARFCWLDAGSGADWRQLRVATQLDSPVIQVNVSRVSHRLGARNVIFLSLSLFPIYLTTTL